MMLSRLFLLAVALLMASPAAAQESNAGIVRGLWYDQEQFFAGNTVRVYAAIRNNTGSDLSGTISFYVNGDRIERKNVEALDGRIVESWGDWVPEYGTSTISATLSRTVITSTASGSKAVNVISALADDIIFVDRDTDNDTVGDREDPDDDGDGIPDSDDEEPRRFNETNEAAVAGTINSATTTKTTTPEDSPSNPAGLEQFLTPSRADAVFTHITEAINNSKRQLDEYRHTRSTTEPEVIKAPLAAATGTVATSSTSTDTTTDTNGFGAITRSSGDAPSSGWLESIWQFTMTVIGGIYTVLLATLSFGLGYPTLVQLLLLFVLLFSIYKIAKKLGSRPS